MRRLVAIVSLGVALVTAPTVYAQGVLGDVLAGKLVKPEVGQWAWYNLIDGSTQKRYLVAPGNCG